MKEISLRLFPKAKTATVIVRGMNGLYVDLNFHIFIITYPICQLPSTPQKKVSSWLHEMLGADVPWQSWPRSCAKLLCGDNNNSSSNKENNRNGGGGNGEGGAGGRAPQNEPVVAANCSLAQLF
jgi:hypothetical protein